MQSKTCLAFDRVAIAVQKERVFGAIVAHKFDRLTPRAVAGNNVYLGALPQSKEALLSLSMNRESSTRVS